MAFTYAQLKTAIQDYTENTETSFVTNLPVFIRAAEDRIFKLDNIGGIGKSAIEEKTKRDHVAVILMENLDLKVTNGNCGARGDGNCFHRWHEIAR